MGLGDIGFMVFDATGAPKTDALPLFAVYRDRSPGNRTPPTGSLATPVPHRGGGLYGVIAPIDDVAAGTAFLINLGAGAFNAGGGTRIFGSVAPDGAPLFAQLFEDAAGALWNGSVPPLGIWEDFTGAAVTPKPNVDIIISPYFVGISPQASEVSAGRLGRFDAPAGAFPQYPHFTALFNPTATAGMTTGEAIRTELVADAGVTALVGTRIYPNMMPQGPRATDSFTAIVYMVVSDTPQNALGGDATDRRRDSRVQIDCYGKRYLDAQALAAAVDAVMTALARPDFAVWRESSRDFYDDAAQLHRVSMDFSVWR